MNKIVYLLLTVFILCSCESKKNEYDPYKINGKEKKIESKSSFEVKFKKTDSNLKTIHVKLNNTGHDVIFDTGCSGVSISTPELNELIKENTLSKDDYRGTIPVQIADGTVSEIPQFNINKITIVDTNGKEHTLSNIVATVEENPAAHILIGSSVIDNFAKKSYTIDLSKKVIRFE